MLGQPITTGFFNSPHFPEHSQLGHTWYLTPHSATLVWLTGYHATPLVTDCSHITIPREAEDFPSGGKYPMDVHLPTFLAYLKPV